MDALTNAATIIVAATGESFHTLDDWGLAIGNNDCIGTPEIEEHYVDVPGVAKRLDMSDALTGYPVYTHRPIRLSVGGIRKRMRWDSTISSIRNKIHGKIVKVIFDNDKSYYWTGRAKVTGYDRQRELGTFTIEIPYAEPYKLAINDSTQGWLWDTFSFRTGIIKRSTDIAVNGSATYTINAGNMPIVPEFSVTSIGSGGLSVEANGENYALAAGRNRFPDLIAYGRDVIYKFTGTGTVTIIYREGSL